MRINTEKLRLVLDKLNDNFTTQHGYRFCRCYFCVFPILVNYLRQNSTVDNQSLGEIVHFINSDYLRSADYRDYIGKSGLKCSYECPHYEDALEAVPFLFWEINKSHLVMIKELLLDEEFLGCFTLD